VRWYEPDAGSAHSLLGRVVQRGSAECHSAWRERDHRPPGPGSCILALRAGGVSGKRPDGGCGVQGQAPWMTSAML
jgi:hypothetical protein